MTNERAAQRCPLFFLSVDMVSILRKQRTQLPCLKAKRATSAGHFLIEVINVISSREKIIMKNEIKNERITLKILLLN